MIDSSKQQQTKILYVVVCAAVPARHVQDFVVLAQAAEWDVYVIATPNATKFIDTPLLESLTGHPVYSEVERQSGQVAPTLPVCTAVLVAPATFNTLKKWAQNATDTFVLRLLRDCSAKGVPVLVVPRASEELAQDPDFSASLFRLCSTGVTILYEPEKYPPNNNVSWQLVLAALHKLLL